MKKFFFLLIPVILILSVNLSNNAFAFSKANNLLEYHNFNNTNCNTPMSVIDESTHAGSLVGEGLATVVSNNANTCFTGVIANGLKFPISQWNNFGNGTFAFNWLHNGQTPWSISFWMLQNDGGGLNSTIFNSQTQNPQPIKGTKGISIKENKNGGGIPDFMELSIGNNGIVFDKTFLNVVPSSNVWEFFVITFNPSTKTMQLYTNATLQGTFSNNTLGGFGTGNSIAEPTFPDFNNMAYMGYDEWAFWDTILNQADVTLLYNSTHAYNLLRGNGLTTSITLNSTSGDKGSNVLVTGSLFGATTNTNIFFDNTLLATVGHIGTSFTQAIQIPANATPGVHTINATDTTGSPAKTAIASFTVITPTLILNSTNGIVGSHISSSGKGYINNLALSFKFDSSFLNTNPVFPATNSTGGFSGITFNIPSATAGHHNINATDLDLNQGSAIYNVTSSLSVSPNIGIPGSTPTISGFGFSGSKTMTIKFDGVTLTPAFGSNPVTDSKGAFGTQQFNIPSTGSGVHTILATDGSHTATASFTTGATVLITPSTGTVATHETSLGKGFTATSPIGVFFDGVSISTIPASPKTDHLGQFNNTFFSIPSTTPGIHAIRIQDGGGLLVDTPYTVTAVSGFSLNYNSLTQNSIGLTWLPPTLFGGEAIQGYQINFTTPHGIPKTIIVNNTATMTTSFTISGLSNNTQYSFRVGIWTSGTSNKNMTNILDVTTLTGTSNGGTSPNLAPGQLNLNVGTNPLKLSFLFTAVNTSPTALSLYVNYPNTFNTTCNFNYQFANVNKTYYNLPTVPNGTGRVYSLFQFAGIGNDLVTTVCRDIKTNATGNYVITEPIDKIPLVQQLTNFSNGQYGTSGQFGAFDLIELLVIILSMIGLNRVNETVGTVIMIIVLGSLAYFHIGSFPVIIFSAIAMVIMLAVASTKKQENQG